MDSNSSDLNVSPADRDLWIRTVIGEAGNDPASIPAVASVIANRMKQTGQPAGQVVLAKGQFEPWQRRPGELLSYAPTSQPYQDAARAVDGIIAGKVVDPTKGATQFYAPAAQAALGRAPPAWDDGSGVQIGAHRFFGGQTVAQNGADDAGEALLQSYLKSPSKGSASPASATNAPPVDTEGEALLQTYLKPGAAAPAPVVPAGQPGSFPLGDPRNQGRIPVNLAPAIPAASAPMTAVDPTQPIGRNIGFAASQLGGYLAGQAAGVPNAIANDFRTSAALVPSWQVEGPTLPSFPSSDPQTWQAGGLLKTAAGLAGAVSSPLTGVVHQFVQDPVTQATGSPQAGENAALVANSLAGPLAGRFIGNTGNALANATFGGLDPETAALANLARTRYGIPVNAGQMASSPAIRFGASALNRLPLSGATGDIARQQAAFNDAVAGTIGEAGGGKLTPQIANAARQRIGDMFDTVAANTTIRADPQFFQDIHDTLNSARMVLPSSETEPLIRQTQNILEKIDPNTGSISGETYQALTRKGTPLDRLLESENPNIAHYASGLKDALDDALQRSASPDMQQMLTTAKYQWRNLMTLKPLVAKATTGDISPALLMGRVNQNTGNGLAFGQGGDLGNLARIGQRFLKEPPSSGTAERLGAMGMLTRVGGLAGAAAGAHEVGLLPGMTPEAMAASAIGIPSSLLAGRAIGSTLRSNWLANQIINRSLYRAAPSNALAGPLAAVSGLGGATSLFNEPVNALAPPNQ